MTRSKRGFPSIVLPQNLNRTLNCKEDKLSDYCRFFGYDVVTCTDKTDQICPPDRGGTLIVRPGPPSPKGFLQLESSVISVGVFAHCILTILCCLLCSSFLLLLIFRFRQLKHPIYMLILQLCICYLLFAIAQCFTSIPLYLFNFQKSSEFISHIPLILEQFGSYGCVIFYTLLTINRSATFLCTCLKAIFEGNSLYVTIYVSWLFSIIAALFSSFFGCERDFDISKGVYYDSCVPGSMATLIFRQIIFYTFVILPFVVSFIYIIIGISIFISRRKAETSSNRSEIDLLVQSAFMVVLYTLTDVFNVVYPHILTDNLEVIYLLDLLNNSLNVLHGFIFVTIFMTLNKSVRKEARELCTSS